MKRFIVPFVALASLSLALVSCNKELENPKAGTSDVNFTISGKVDPTLTKTYIEEQGSTYLAHWSATSDEKLGLLFDDVDGTAASTTFDAFDITNDIATFSGTAALSLGNHTIHPFYPATAFNKGYSTGKIGLTLNATQYPFTDTFDPAADIMIGGDQTITVEDADSDGNPDEVLIENIVFTRPMAVIRLHLVAKNDQAKAYGETVTSVEMNVPGQASTFALTGSLSYTPDNAEFDWNTKNASVRAVYETAHNNADQVLIDTDADYNSVYLVVNPTTIPSGTIEFTIETDVHNGINAITRTVNVPAGGMEFLAGKVNEINLTVRDKDVPDIVTDTRILVEGFDNVTTNKTQPAASATGVFGTGVSNNLEYTYSTDNTNIRFNNNGQSSDNPYLYINAADQYLTISNIVVDNQTDLDFSAKVKNAATLTLKYKESSSSTWNTAGTHTSTSSFSDASISFVIANTVESLDLQIIGSAALIVDDIVLKPGSAKEKVATPTFTVAEGTYDSAQSVEIQCTTDGATIHYTVDGTDPTSASAAYSSAISVSATTTIKAIAVKTGMLDSEIASATYTINGSTPPAADSWVLTDLADLNAGDVFVIVGGTTVALPHNDGTSSSPDQVSVTVANNEITSTVTDAMKWNVSGNSTDGYTFYPNGSTTTWLYCNTTASSSSNDNIRVGTGARKVWELNNSGYLVTKDEYATRYLSLNGTTDWRSYVNTNTNPQVISFYKYTVNDGKSDAAVTLGYSGGTITYGDSPVQLILTNPYNVAVTYSADPTGVVSVSNAGLATIEGAGTTTVTASWIEQTISGTTYREGSASYELTVVKATPTIAAFADSNVEIDVNGSVTKTTTINPNTLSIVYTTSDATVASIDANTGEVTGHKDGNVTISATFAGNDNYAAAETKTYSLKVGNGGSVVYSKVTSTTDLTDGTYLIVYETGGLAFDGSLETLDAVSNTIAVTITSSTIVQSATIDASSFTYDATNKTLQSASGYYIGQTSNANGLASSSTNTYENTISFESNGDANIVSGGAYLRYNSASNQARFRYYKSSSYTGQQAIQLYKRSISL